MPDAKVHVSFRFEVYKMLASTKKRSFVVLDVKSNLVRLATQLAENVSEFHEILKNVTSQ